MKKQLVLMVLVGIVTAGIASGEQVFVSQNIDTSTTWTADNVYSLQNQVYVLPGATLTIEAGTLIQSTAYLGGSLAVCRGAQLGPFSSPSRERFSSPSDPKISDQLWSTEPGSSR